MASLNPYGKLNEADQERLVARRKTRRRITIIAVSSIVLVAVVVAAAVGVTQTRDNGNNKSSKAGMSTSLKASCATTLYPDSCYTSLSPLVKSRNVSPQDLYKLSLQVSIDELSKASNQFLQNVVKKLNITDKRTLAAVESCRELCFLALDHINDSMSVGGATVFEAVHDLRTWLSSAGTYQQTCIDELSAASAVFSSLAEEHFRNSTEYTSNSLAFVSAIEESVGTLGGVGRRRLMSASGGGGEWLSLMLT